MQCIVLQGTHRSARRMRLSLDTYFTLLPVYYLYVLFDEISYQTRFCLQILYPAILFTKLMRFLNCGSFIVDILLPGTMKVNNIVSFPAT